jgi:hypothetical protein
MSRIPRNALLQAVASVKAMDDKQKELLADELFRVQPNLFGSALVLSRLGVSMDKVGFALELLFVCFRAMKESGLTWPVITEAELDRQSLRFVGIVKFGDDLGESLRHRSIKQYVEDHPEKDLLAYVQMETMSWLKRVAPEETDKYVILAIWNFVNCIAFVSMKQPLPAR